MTWFRYHQCLVNALTRVCHPENANRLLSLTPPLFCIFLLGYLRAHMFTPYSRTHFIYISADEELEVLRRVAKVFEDMLNKRRKVERNSGNKGALMNSGN